MFKKIILFIFVFSPLWYSLFIGYPVISEKQFQIRQKEQPTVSVSKRCFGVGEFNQFINCFASSERVSGIDLLSEVTTKVNSISFLLIVILLVSFVVFIIAAIILIS